MLTRLASLLGLQALYLRQLTSVTAETPAQKPFDRLPETDQWTRLSDCMATAVQRASDVTGHHTAAGSQLDAATYALQQLRSELGPVMPVFAQKAAATEPDAAVTADPGVGKFRRRKSMAA
jgi:hypothetical protein